MKITELYDKLSQKLPASLSCEWDNDGLMCFDGDDRPVRRVLCALDASERAVARAVEGGYDVLLTHHPLIFSPLKRVGTNAAGRKLVRLIKSGVCVMSFHTRLDAAEGGVNDILARKLGLTEIEPFGGDAGNLGRVGTVGGGALLDKFCQTVKSALSSPALSVAGNVPVRRVAVIGGDGKDYVGDAVAAGADTYVSGSLGYHNMNDAPEMGINLIEAGHFYTENIVCKYLAELVTGFDPTITVDIFDINEIRIV